MSIDNILDFLKPPPPPVPVPASAPPHWKHQLQTIERGLENPRFLDFSDPGTGKTRAHVDIFRARLERNETTKLLVLAPKTLLEAAWADDIRAYQPDLKVSVAWAANREEAFEEDADVFITNVDAVKWLAKQNKRWWSKRFARNPTLVIDELTAYKTFSGTQRSEAAKQIKDYFTFRTGMTATPTPNSVTELWNQLYIIDDGERLGSRYFKFRSAVCDPVQTGPRPEHRIWVDKDGIEEAVAMLHADITIRHIFEECMDIPPNFSKMVRFDLPPKLYQQYLEMEATSILKLQDRDIVGIHAGVVRNKLLQIISGAVYNSPGDEQRYTLLDDSRYELVSDLVAQTKHSVVFYNWEHQKHETVKYLKKRGIEYAVIDKTVSDKGRNEIRRAYQRGDFQTLLLHPQTGAHGLTLTKGTSTIWSSPVYQSDFLKQGKHRIYRGGQTKRTYTRMVSARDTVDEDVYLKVGRKAKRMATFLELLEERRARR